MDNSLIYSDFSDEESAEEFDIYRKKYQLILERCDVLKQDNERLVNRINTVKKIIKRRRKERKLDLHGDSWRHIYLTLDLDDPAVVQPSNSRSNKNQKGDKSKKVKRKGTKTDKNAPKRPANPYFQFCQEKRNSTIEEMTTVGQPEPSKIDVTKHLATKWNLLSQDDRKIYYDMYEKSKERYAADMQLYTAKKDNNQQEN